MRFFLFHILLVLCDLYRCNLYCFNGHLLWCANLVDWYGFFFLFRLLSDIFSECFFFVVHVAEMWAGFSTGLLCLGVARNWPRLMRTWKRMEDVMGKYEIPYNFRLKLHALMVSVAFIIICKKQRL